MKEFSFRPFPEHEEEQKEDTASGGIKHSKLPSSRMKTSVWNCDGEVIPHPSLQVRLDYNQTTIRIHFLIICRHKYQFSTF